jgi:hypothetical protein
MRTAKTPNQKILAITWDSVAKDVKAAVLNENTAAKKWTLLADKFWILGVRFADFVKPAGKDAEWSANYKKIEGQVLAALGTRAARLVPLHGTGMAFLTEVERSDKRHFEKKRNTMMGRVAEYVKKLEATDGKGPVKKAHSVVLLEVVKYWQARLKANEEKITDFDSLAVVELFEQIKKELT